MSIPIPDDQLEPQLHRRHRRDLQPLRARLASVVGTSIALTPDPTSANGVIIPEAALENIVSLLQIADDSAADPFVSGRVSITRTALLNDGDGYTQETKAVQAIPGETVAEMAHRVLDVDPVLVRERDAAVHVRLAPRQADR